MNHPRTPSRRRRATLAAVGLAAVAAVAVPTAAHASGSTPAVAATTATSTSTATTTDPSRCTPLQRWTALSTAAPKIAAYLQAHSDLNTELATLKALPKDQRRAEARTYLAAHPDEKAALKDARAALVSYRHTCHA